MNTIHENPFRHKQETAQAAEKVAAALRLFVEPGQVTELRALDVRTSDYGRPVTKSGFFDYDHLDDMAAQAIRLESSSKGVYLVPNPINRDFLAVRRNRVDTAQNAELTTDRDVLRRRLLLIDADPKRIRGVSSTDAEKAMAWDVVVRARDYLFGLQVGDVRHLLSDSGNGFHLLLGIDEDNTDEVRDLARDFLHHLDDRFSTDDVTVDTAVFNAARIVKLYGTLARKGENDTLRPHRRSGVLEHGCGLAFDGRLFRELAAKGREAREARECVRSAAHRPAAAAPSGAVLVNIDRKKIIRRAEADSLKWTPSVQGDKGSRRLMYAVNRALNGWGLSREEARPIIDTFNARCQPTWSPREIERAMDNTEQKGDKEGRPRGYLAGEDRFGYEPPAPAVPPTPAAVSGASVVAAAGGDGADLMGSSGVHEEVDDPHRLARIYLARRRHRDGPTLRRHRAGWHLWEGAAYRLASDEEIKLDLTGAIKSEFDRHYLATVAAMGQHAAEAAESNGLPAGSVDGHPDAPKVRAKKVTTAVVGNAHQRWPA
jgi:hypothetical protein